MESTLMGYAASGLVLGVERPELATIWFLMSRMSLATSMKAHRS